MRILTLLLLFVYICYPSCTDPGQKGPETDPSLHIQTREGFVAELLYKPKEHDQGSWVAMCFDDRGRLITSDQYGALYRIALPPIGADSTRHIQIDTLTIGAPGLEKESRSLWQIGFAHGLLYAYNSLYVVVNNARSNDQLERTSGLYRLQDTDSDDHYDKITLLKTFEGDGEHGPHSIIQSPDKKHLYLVAGNHTELPEMDHYLLPKSWNEDNLLPVIRDPRGHATDRRAPGGWIARTDSLGSHWELVSAGYRNPFDIAFNSDGELFTYDSDMEWDIGLPWYRPTRICHVTYGSEYGWRTGNHKWSSSYPDNLPSVLNIGQGSPTNLLFGEGLNFPEKYRESLFAFDWSFGIIYAIHLKESGASFSGHAEEFLSGVPLPLTDGAVGPDGAMYFMTGGRRLESGLYRVYYTGKLKKSESNKKQVANDLRDLRHRLETYQLSEDPKALDTIWPFLGHDDRFISYAARIALEHLPLTTWSDKAFEEKNPSLLIQAMLALARQNHPILVPKMTDSLTAIDFSSLTSVDKLNLVRVFEIILFRNENLNTALIETIRDYLDPHFPEGTNELNRLMIKVLAYCSSSYIAKKAVALVETAADDPAEISASHSSDLIFRNPQYGMDIASMLSGLPPAQQIFLAVGLSQLKEGWTEELRDRYFQWFRKAFEFKGGPSYVGFINKARLMALESTPENKRNYYDSLSGADLLDETGNALFEVEPPDGPGRNWNLADAVAMIDSGLVNRDFERGKRMYIATRCMSCHQMNGQGSNIGPDLSQLGRRFSNRDVLESLIEPDKEVSEQYAATVLSLKDGTTIVGRLMSEGDRSYSISQNPFVPDALREIKKSDVLAISLSKSSIMFPRLINPLNPDELRDLMAYLMSGGNREHLYFKPIE